MREVDVQALMQEIGVRIGCPDALPPPPASCLSSNNPPTGTESFALVSEALHLSKAAVGRLPAAPPTVRARLGALLVKAVRRSLFWLLPQLDDFHSRLIEGLDLQFDVAKRLSVATHENWAGVQLVRQRADEIAAEMTQALARQMAARERAEDMLRAEIAAREQVEQALRTLSLSVAASTSAVEASLQRLHSDLYLQNTRVSRLLKPAIPAVAPAPPAPQPKAESKPWEIAICGTFDVSKYGDLLFPIIAEFELGQRLGAVVLHRLSYHPKAVPLWPYNVTSVTELPEMIGRLDGLLVGGGFLIRFDKDVAPGYGPPGGHIHHPTGYWLTPALMALQHNVPVVWNAPGMHDNELPAWGRNLLEMALSASAYVSVRDELSQTALERLTANTVTLVPDTVFGLSRLIDFDADPSPDFLRLAKECGLERPYLVFQPCRGFEGVIRTIRSHPERFGRFQFLILPVSPEFGESPDSIEIDLPRVIRLPEWPSPLTIAELIGRSEAAFGHSYHFNVAALVAGVPAFRRVDLISGKFTSLRRFETVHVLPAGGEIEADWLLARIGRTAPSPSVLAALRELDDHWNRIADVLRSKPSPSAPAIDRFWQSLPTLLEDIPGANSNHRPRLLNIDRIRTGRLETEPYRWAEIDNLFAAGDARDLAATYPCDHYKLVAGHDGEKEYEYDARSLIGMGAEAASYPGELSQAWRRLAADLLSPEYRAAMSALTGYDLTGAPMEANVFHYGPGCSLGAHKDLPEKLVTHVLYFNRSWDGANGGCLCILRSGDLSDLAMEVLPVVGNSAVLVRSDRSWHAVSRVVGGTACSRRSVTVTFYRPGSVSTMWPPGDSSPLRHYAATDGERGADGC